MALVLIKGRELCVLNAAPDAWTGEMFVLPNQAYTLLFFLHLSLCKKNFFLKLPHALGSSLVPGKK